MMHPEIRIEKLSKRFKRNWLFKDLDHCIKPGDRLAILGSNGSGKSTLLKCLCGAMKGSSGTVKWISGEDVLQYEHLHEVFAISTPYLEMIEEFTLGEMLDFHFSLKRLRSDVDLNVWLEKANLSGHRNKAISRFSSGMIQRLKLILCLASDVPVYLLDEPCSNMDFAGIEWYQSIIRDISIDSTIIIASNSPEEYQICTRTIQISEV